MLPLICLIVNKLGRFLDRTPEKPAFHPPLEWLAVLPGWGGPNAAPEIPTAGASTSGIVWVWGVRPALVSSKNPKKWKFFLNRRSHKGLKS